MDISLYLGERDLSRILCIKDEQGNTVVMVGFVVTLFFEHPLTRASREVVAEVADSYISLVREHLRWARDPRTWRPQPFESGRVELPGKWLPNHPDGAKWMIGFHSGETSESTSTFRIEALGTGIAEVGYLHMSLPLSWFADYGGTLPDLVLRTCRRLIPLSGYAGIGILEAPDACVKQEHELSVRALAERFPGLEIEKWPGHIIHVHEGIKGVNWLTVLGERWINEMGGIEYLRSRLDENFEFHGYEGGVIIQAGSKPYIGDATLGLWPQHYVTLAKVLKKIQIKDHYPLQFGKPGRMDYEASKAWLFRFDGK
jgi:hypothetical protein